MIQTKILLAGATMAACTALLTPSNPPAPPPVPGPGGVIHAVKDFVAAIDRGDKAALEKLLAPESAGGVFGFEGDNERLRQLDDTGPTAIEVGPASPTPFERNGQKSIAASVVKQVSVAGLETRIRSIRADCPSERLSFAVVEFDRTYLGTKKGAEPTVVPMRATALLQYRDDGFVLFHWHASRR